MVKELVEKVQKFTIFYNFVKKNKESVAIAIVIVIVGIFYLPLVKNITTTAINENDWWRNYYNFGLSRKNLIDYRQISLRTPFLGGGYPLIGRPTDPSLSPIFLLVLFFGEISGLRLLVFLLFVSGATGMFYLTRRVLLFSTLGAIFSSLVFGLCSWGVYQAVDGNLEKIYYYIMPWLLAFFIRSVSEKKEEYFIFSIFLSALILLSSPIILLPICLFLFLYSCLHTVRKENNGVYQINPNYLINILLIVFFTLILCSFKILPFLHLYSMRIADIHAQYGTSYEQAIGAIKYFGSSLSIKKLWMALLDPTLRDYSTMYIGAIPLFIFIFSAFIFISFSWRYAILLLVFISIWFGPNSFIDIYKLFWNMKFFGHSLLRLDKYFGFFPIFIIALVGGKFFDIFKKKGKTFIAAAVLLIIVSAASMYFNNKLIFGSICYERIPSFKKYDSFFSVVTKDARIERRGTNFSEVKDLRSYKIFWILLQQNIGIANFNWKEGIKIGEYAVPKYIIDLGPKIDECVFVEDTEDLSQHNLIDLTVYAQQNPSYREEVYFVREENSAKIKRFSANAIDIDVGLKNPDILVINQNYHPSWKTSSGLILNYHGLLAIKFEKEGDYKVRLSYAPREFTVGILISLIGLVSILRWKFADKDVRSINENKAN